jgi:sugar O-acyltransferase (sialic acid O-acetyltransferase NeuD family)
MKITILGTGGHARSCADICENIGYTSISYIDVSRPPTELKREIFEQIRDDKSSVLKLCLGVGANYFREDLFNLFANNDNFSFPIIVDPSAYISKTAVLEPGVVIMPNSSVRNGSRLGVGSLVNTNAVVDHDTEVNAFASLAPGAICGGGSTMGERSFLGLNSVLRESVSIGSDVVIGANSFVNQDIQNNCTAFGNPAKFIKSRNRSDRFLLGSNFSIKL